MNQAVSEVCSTVTLVKRCECYGATHLSIKLVHRFSTNVVVRRTFLILWVLDRVLNLADVYMIPILPFSIQNTHFQVVKLPLFWNQNAFLIDFYNFF